MSLNVRTIARRQLDKRLAAVADAQTLRRPDKGWIKAIREALGMSTAALANRMGISQPGIIRIEEAEAKGNITLDTLERAARALNCELVYVLKPITSLDQTIEDQAMSVVRKKLSSTRHTMALEAQSLDRSDDNDLIRMYAKELKEKAGSKLWGRNE